MSINPILYSDAAAAHPSTDDTSAMEAAQTLLSMALAALPKREEGGQTTLNPKKRKLHNSWTDDEIEVVKNTASIKEAIRALGTTRHSERSIQNIWRQIAPECLKRALNSWSGDEIKILKKANSAKEAVRTLGTKRHTIMAIRAKWWTVTPKCKKQACNLWTDHEIEVIKSTASTKEAIEALGTKRHTMMAIETQWYKIAKARRNSI